MTYQLVNFSIESDNSILLFFLDGTQRRVCPSELPNILKSTDLQKVNKALYLRKSFIRNVLPPGALVLLVSATIFLGIYDLNRVAEMIQKAAPTQTQTNEAEPKKSTTPPQTQPQIQSQPLQQNTNNSSSSPLPAPESSVKSASPQPAGVGIQINPTAPLPREVNAQNLVPIQVNDLPVLAPLRDKLLN